MNSPTDEPATKSKSVITDLMSSIKKISTILGILGVIVSSIYTVFKIIDYTIESKLKNPELLREISRLIRPSVIFDNKGIILADQGAMEFIESINFEYDAKVKKLPTKIIITPKKFLALPPLLTSLDQFLFDQTASRGQGFAWIYSLHISSYQETLPSYRFRIEILN